MGLADFSYSASFRHSDPLADWNVLFYFFFSTIFTSRELRTAQLIKSAMGINISQSKTAPDWVKLPIVSILEARNHNHDHG
jgi:hypothetical protein